MNIYNILEIVNMFHKYFFQELCIELAPHLPKPTNRTVGVEKKILSTLWTLGNQESFRGVSDRFGLSKGNLHHIFLQVCHTVVTNLLPKYVQWPQAEELIKISEGFRKKCGFPGVVGAIDGTHIPITGPKHHRASYINRKGVPSMQLQAVCDSTLKFTDIHCGWPGSVHDNRVFKNSPLCKYLTDNLSREKHLLGDSAYALSEYVLVPYRDYGHLTAIEKNFNVKHSSTRVSIENDFGLLKCKFRRLHHLPMLLEYEIPAVISAACVLHNFIIIKEKFDENEIEAVEYDAGPQDQDSHAVSPAAEAKRKEIAYLLF